VQLQRVGNPGGFRRPAHWLSTGDNGLAAGLLDRVAPK
jgi:hypothetical protein